MDQQPQAPRPPQPPTGPPQPPTGPQQPPTGPQQPNPYGAPQPSGNKKTGLIIGIIIAAVLLIGGGVTALVITLNNKDSKSSSQSSSKSDDSSKKKDDSKSDSADNDDKLRSANATTAKYLTEFDAVCSTGSISNAADYTKPYKIVAFYGSPTRDDNWSQVSLPYKATYKADYDKFETTNVVACLTPDKASAVKSKTCDFKSGSDNVSIDYYAVKYNVSLYEAKSGKKIKDLGTVNGPADTCPTFATYSKSDPKIYAKPDTASLDGLLAGFAAQ